MASYLVDPQEHLIYYIQKHLKYGYSLLQGERVNGPIIIDSAQRLYPNFNSSANFNDNVSLHPRVIGVAWDNMQQ